MSRVGVHQWRTLCAAEDAYPDDLSIGAVVANVPRRWGDQRLEYVVASLVARGLLEVTLIPEAMTSYADVRVRITSAGREAQASVAARRALQDYA